MSSSEDEDVGDMNDGENAMEEEIEEDVVEEESESEESDAEVEAVSLEHDGEGEGEADGEDVALEDADQEMEADSDEDEDSDEDGSQEQPDEPEEPDLPRSPTSTTSSKSSLPSIKRAVSPTQARRDLFTFPSISPKAFSIEPVSAIPHPSPSHSLAASLCLSYLLTGSEDGYIRAYDIFTGLNGKTLLTAPQRHHCGLGESIVKASVFRTWWDNPIPSQDPSTEPQLSPVYSMAVQADALWGLSGTVEGGLNLFTIRHEPGRIHHQISVHKGPISALALQEDEKGVYSAGWDGTAAQCDLNTGQIVRTFPTHGAQLTAVAIRPLTAPRQIVPDSRAEGEEGLAVEEQAVPNGSERPLGAVRPAGEKTEDYDPLFDDDEPTEAGATATANAPVKEEIKRTIGPKAIPLLNSDKYASYSNDVLLTASIDGQVILWDRRVNSPGKGIGRLDLGDRPPWCISACWSHNGSEIFVGRRNATIDVWDVRSTGRDTPRVLKTLRNPAISGAVTCVAAFPDCRHIVCASQDNIRLWNVHAESRGGAPFKIIAGHHGGIVSQILIDASSKFMITASGNRGWSGESTKTILVHEIKAVLT